MSSLLRRAVIALPARGGRPEPRARVGPGGERRHLHLRGRGQRGRRLPRARRHHGHRLRDRRRRQDARPRSSPRSASASPTPPASPASCAGSTACRRATRASTPRRRTPTGDSGGPTARKASWTYSSYGVGSLTVPAGGSVGWSWQQDRRPVASVPPAVAPPVAPPRRPRRPPRRSSPSSSPTLLADRRRPTVVAPTATPSGGRPVAVVRARPAAGGGGSGGGSGSGGSPARPAARAPAHGDPVRHADEPLRVAPGQ